MTVTGHPAPSGPTPSGPAPSDAAMVVDQALAARAGRYVLAELDVLTGEQLDRPTPCAGWAALDVVRHLSDVADGLLELLVTGRLRLPASSSPDGGDPVGHARARIGQVVGELRAGGPRPPDQRAQWAATAARAAAIEFTAHAWDLAAASGRADSMPAELAEDVLTLASEALDDTSRGTDFAAPVTIDPGGPPGDQLVAFLGRDPGWRPAGADDRS